MFKRKPVKPDAAPFLRGGRLLPFLPTEAEATRIRRIAEIEAADCNNGNVVRAMRSYDRLMLGVAATCNRVGPDGCIVPPPPGIEGWAMVLTGPSAVGKSNVLKNIVQDPRLAFRTVEGFPWMPILALTAPSPSTIKTLGSKMLETMGAEPAGAAEPEHYILHRVRKALVALGVVVVLIDEFHHALVDRNSGDRKRLAETMKNLMKGEPLLVPAKLNERDLRIVEDRTFRHPVHLILAGTPDLQAFAKARKTHSADQFANKARVTAFEEIKVLMDAGGGRTYQGLEVFIRNLVSAMGFPDGEAEALVTADMLARFYKAGAHHLGRCADLLKRAAILVVTSERQATIHSKLPEAFEELYATGADKNLFLVPDISKCPDPPRPVEAATKADFKTGGGHAA